MRFIAQELREYMAKFGVRTLDELVGRTDLLKVKDVPTSERASTLNLEQILDNPYEGTKTPMTFNPKKVFDFELEKTLDEKVLVKELLPAVEKKQKRSIEIDVTNTNRTFGTILWFRDYKKISGRRRGRQLCDQMYRSRRSIIWCIYSKGSDTGTCRRRQ